MEAVTYLLVYLILCSLLRTSITLDTIAPTQSFRDGDTLVSAGGRFQMGFFSPGNSKGRYLGIWYTVSSGTVLWVANRDTPVNDHSGVLKVTDKVLIILNSTNSIVWSSSNSSRTAKNPVLQLLDNGNLVVKDENVYDPVKFLWQSFDYPCDTLLSDMKLGRNLVTGLDRFITSWKSTDDPGQGEFSMRLDTRGLPQVFVMKGGTIKARVGSWNGVRLSGYTTASLNPIFGYEFVLNENEVYYEYKLKNSLALTRYVINPSGIVQRFTWMSRTHLWELFSTFPADQCANYAYCGADASCNVDKSPVCGCLERFLPKSPKKWDSMDWTDGCVRRTPLNCSGGDGFLKYVGLKLPDTSSSWFDKTMSRKECEGLCLKNCSCTAYANLDTRGEGSGCLVWFGNLVDIIVLDGGQDLYVRMAASELGMTKRNPGKEYDIGGGKEDIELPIFDLMSVVNATDNFSRNNKLGEGGFGPVYKGILLEGKEIAVKRLSKNSGQGLNEFKNEVIFIAKLQHRNLVKLLDFGLAKSFGEDQCDARTNRIIGTYGYMSPEYVVHGQYSIKSDVFSFGVLILEIVSGKKNRGFHHPEHHLNLLGHAWRLWIEDRPIELINDSVGDFTVSEVLRCIHVGLLCVQKRQEDRPNMSSMVQMLSSENLLPKPRQPGFYIGSPEAYSSSSTHCSENEITFTLFEAR
uniref:Receptor-like serine/threonine-protein kinase n=1 Tax=Fagus sylvatica TaxID=28930 RepID=A0A2N9HM72_FAGSY